MSLDVTARGGAAALSALLVAGAAYASPEEDRRTVAALDTAYQAAVERNDADSMGRILHDDMILVVGRGIVVTREELLRSARTGEYQYEHQVEDEGTQAVRLYGENTAIVTALLWLKGRGPEGPFDRRLWFSDTYVRTAEGWRYAFGQSSIALPPQ
jgi:ketosteroid isomerase-like protein